MSNQRNFVVNGLLVAAVLAAATGVAFANSKHQENETISNDKTAPKPAAESPTRTAVQRAIADRIAALMTPRNELARDPSGVPPQLADGIIGWQGRPTKGYMVVVGAGQDPEAVVAKLIVGLPPEARELVHATVASVSAEELARIWRTVSDCEWSSTANPTFVLDIDAAETKVVVSIDPSTPEKDQKALRAAGGSYLRVEFSQGIGRLPRTTDSAAD